MRLVICLLVVMAGCAVAPAPIPEGDQPPPRGTDDECIAYATECALSDDCIAYTCCTGDLLPRQKCPTAPLYDACELRHPHGANQHARALEACDGVLPLPE